MTDTKKHVEEYIRVNQTINELKSQLKTLNEAKKRLEASIMDFMDETNSGELDCADFGCQIIYTSRDTKEALTKKVYFEYFRQEGKDPETEYAKVNEYRGLVKKKSLKIVST